jgi:hypothetical protein
MTFVDQISFWAFSSRKPKSLIYVQKRGKSSTGVPLPRFSRTETDSGDVGKSKGEKPKGVRHLAGTLLGPNVQSLAARKGSRISAIFG